MENEKEKLEKLREIIGEILYGIHSDFKYCGHGNNLGMWSTSDEDELKWTVLEKPDGPDEIDLAMFRVTVYLPNRFGIQIKVEMFPSSIYEWDGNGLKWYVKDDDLCHVYFGDTFCLRMRGWGFLTGVGSLNLPCEESKAIQDSLRDWIVDRLNGL